MSVLHRSQQFTSFDWHKGDPQALYKGVSRGQDGGGIGGLREPECQGRGVRRKSGVSGGHLQQYLQREQSLLHVREKPGLEMQNQDCVSWGLTRANWSK